MDPRTVRLGHQFRETEKKLKKAEKKLKESESMMTRLQLKVRDLEKKLREEADLRTAMETILKGQEADFTARLVRALECIDDERALAALDATAKERNRCADLCEHEGRFYRYQDADGNWHQYGVEFQLACKIRGIPFPPPAKKE